MSDEKSMVDLSTAVEILSYAVEVLASENPSPQDVENVTSQLEALRRGLLLIIGKGEKLPEEMRGTKRTCPRCGKASEIVAGVKRSGAFVLSCGCLITVESWESASEVTP